MFPCCLWVIVVQRLWLRTRFLKGFRSKLGFFTVEILLVHVSAAGSRMLSNRSGLSLSIDGIREKGTELPLASRAF